jgi:predicted outer membrane repeat protein
LDYRRYSTLMQNAINLASRRRVLNVLAGLGLATSVTGMATSSDAKRGKKHRKVRLCHNGNTLRVSVKRKKKLLRQGATRGACSLECTPSCGTNELCVDGRCQPCSVTCNSAPEQCGEALQKALSKGGTVYACPGRYARNFLLPNDVALIGAGQGMDPSSDTILDAQGQGNVVRVSLGTTTTLRDVRITGGKAFGHGGGIENRGTLVLSSCTIDDNHAPVPNSGGGGIGNFYVATLKNCTVSRNTSSTAGGGIYNDTSCRLTVEGSTINGNTSNLGGGLSNGGKATLDSSTHITGNTARLAGGGGGIDNDVSGRITLNGADVSGNTPNNCIGVSKCAANPT